MTERKLSNDTSYIQWYSPDTMPEDGNFMVCLDKPMLGSKIWPSRRINKIWTIGALFYFDLKADYKIVAWAHELPEPKLENMK